jgi:glutamate 5-kinase
MGKSLLPSGLVAVEGEFGEGDSVRCVNLQGEPVAVGLTNFNSTNLLKIKGMRTSEISKILGYKANDEVMHRDNMVVL